MKNFFRDKFEYNYSSNQKVISLFENDPDKASEKAITLISHTLNAHHIWNRRVLDIPASLNVWDIYDISELQKINSQIFTESLQIVEKEDFNTIIEYTNSLGNNYSNAIEDILFHIINHSTYHRGQIISELKEKGVAPIATDFIFYKR